MYPFLSVYAAIFFEVSGAKYKTGEEMGTGGKSGFGGESGTGSEEGSETGTEYEK
jgi:hypothetical protein